MSTNVDGTKTRQNPVKADVRLIALDLDGTLLNSNKELTPTCRDALDRAAAAGIEIVPTTGRFFEGMPEAVRALPYLHYAITINGAQVYDIRRGAVVYRAEMPCEQAVDIMRALDPLPVIYDCYMDNWGWMNRDMWERCGDYVPNMHYFKMVRELRQPVDDVKEFLLERGHSVQKVQLFTRDMPLRARLLVELREQFVDVAVSTSLANNIEINHKDANKGAALLSLAEYLHIDRSQIAAFGDGMNDLSMIEAAGIGVAMDNAHPDVKARANYITQSCDADGVAAGIDRYCLAECRG